MLQHWQKERRVHVARNSEENPGQTALYEPATLVDRRQNMLPLQAGYIAVLEFQQAPEGLH